LALAAAWALGLAYGHMGAMDTARRRTADAGRGLVIAVWRAVSAFTPLFGVIDTGDVEYLRAAIRRDISWIDSLGDSPRVAFKASSARDRAESAEGKAAEVAKGLTGSAAKAAELVREAAQGVKHAAADLLAATDGASRVRRTASDVQEHARRAEVAAAAAATALSGVADAEKDSASAVASTATEIVRAATDLAVAASEQDDAASGSVNADRLRELRRKLETLASESDSPSRVERGWTDYGAYRLELLGLVPPDARRAVLEELRMMKAVVLEESHERWEALAVQVDGLLRDQPQHGAIPHKIQELWREIDWSRGLRRSRVAKFTRTTQYTWVLLVMATAATLFFARGFPNNDVSPVLVVVLGFLGGAASALRSVDGLQRADRSSAEVESVKLRLRPYVGAMAAIVLYIVARSGILFEIVQTGAGDASKPAAHVQVQLAADQIKFAYYTLAFVAGLSERLFLSLLDQAGTRFGSGDGGTSGGAPKAKTAIDAQPGGGEAKKP
jgi:hypothetical protein